MMINIRNTLQGNNYPVSIMSSSTNIDRTIKDSDDKYPVYHT